MKTDTEARMTRLHPSRGGVTASYDDQTFKGVSPDIFIEWDKFDASRHHRITRKFNVHISINPTLYSAEKFFKYYTTSANKMAGPFESEALKKVKKCEIHGDKETGLVAHANLMQLLRINNGSNTPKPLSFNVGKLRYNYHSIGVAANNNFAPVGQRESSHFEIKFIRVQDNQNTQTEEFLCINIHLTGDKNSTFDASAVHYRLQCAILLFYQELGIILPSSKNHAAQTDLKLALGVSSEGNGFSCGENIKSKEATENNLIAQRYMNKPKPLQLSDFMTTITSKGTATKKSVHNGNAIRLFADVVKAGGDNKNVAEDFPPLTSVNKKR